MRYIEIDENLIFAPMGADRFLHSLFPEFHAKPDFQGALPSFESGEPVLYYSTDNTESCEIFSRDGSAESSYEHYARVRKGVYEHCCCGDEVGYYIPKIEFEAI